MKTWIVIALMAWSATASAWISTDPKQQVYTFKFNYSGETFEVRRPAQSYEDAFEKAADDCFKYFKKEAGGKVSEDKGLDIIDVCANPRA